MKDNEKNEKQYIIAKRFPDLQDLLTQTYGFDKGNAIFFAAEKILVAELKTVDDRGNKMIGKHLRSNILPGYACYRAMVDSGISGTEAVEFVKDELCKIAERMARFSARLSSKKYAFGLVRFAVKTALNRTYPKQGWTITALENSKEQVRFDITSCLYCEELQKRSASELCPAFCYTDVVSYGPLAPAVLFIRQNTFAQTGEKCDFCFKKGKL